MMEHASNAHQNAKLAMLTENVHHAQKTLTESTTKPVTVNLDSLMTELTKYVNLVPLHVQLVKMLMNVSHVNQEESNLHSVNAQKDNSTKMVIVLTVHQNAKHASTVSVLIAQKTESNHHQNAHALHQHSNLKEHVFLVIIPAKSVFITPKIVKYVVTLQDFLQAVIVKLDTSMPEYQNVHLAHHNVKLVMKTVVLHAQMEDNS